MNTQPAYAPPNAELDRPTLGDLLRAVEALRRGALNAPEAEFEPLAMRVVQLAEDLEHMTGYWDGAEVYETPPATARDKALENLLEVADRNVKRALGDGQLRIAVRDVKEATR